MHRTLIASALAALALAAPALADEQLARSLGVEPGAYTLAELSLLRQARQENDAPLARRIEAGASADASRSSLSTFGIGTPRTEGPSAGAARHRQLAASPGLDPAEHSLADLAQGLRASSD